MDTLFRLVDTTKATRMSELTGEKWKSLVTMVGNRKEVNPEVRRAFNRLIAQAVTLGFGNVIDRVRGQKKPDEEGDWETMSPEKRREILARRQEAEAEAAAAAAAAAQETAPEPAPEESPKDQENLPGKEEPQE